MKLDQLFEIIGAPPNEIDKIYIQRLKSRGYVVELRGPWETVKHICYRLHISTSKFRRRMKRRPRPHPTDIDVGESGRTILIKSNPTLDKFLIGPNGLAEVTPERSSMVVLKIIVPHAKVRKMARRGGPPGKRRTRNRHKSSV